MWAAGYLPYHPTILTALTPTAPERSRCCGCLLTAHLANRALARHRGRGRSLTRGRRSCARSGRRGRRGASRRGRDACGLALRRSHFDRGRPLCGAQCATPRGRRCLALELLRRAVGRKRPHARGRRLARGSHRGGARQTPPHARRRPPLQHSPCHRNTLQPPRVRRRGRPKAGGLRAHRFDRRGPPQAAEPAEGSAEERGLRARAAARRGGTAAGAAARAALRALRARALALGELRLHRA